MALEFYTSQPKVEFGLVPCTCCNRLVRGKIIHWPDDVEKIPMNMPCKSCGKWLGHHEEVNQDVLGEMCIECFKEEFEL